MNIKETHIKYVYIHRQSTSTVIGLANVCSFIFHNIFISGDFPFSQRLLVMPKRRHQFDPHIWFRKFSSDLNIKLSTQQNVFFKLLRITILNGPIQKHFKLIDSFYWFSLEITLWNMFSVKPFRFIIFVSVIFPIEFCHGVVFPIGEFSFSKHICNPIQINFKKKKIKRKLVKRLLLENSVYF